MTQAHTPMTEKPRILLVDDEPANLELLLSIFGEGYQVLVAKDGETALARAGGATPPDLVLLDVEMAGLDGYEVCRRLKAQEATRDIPVIFVTSLGEVGDETKGLSLGAVDYITKPISPAIVRARVETHLRLRATQRALELEQRRIRSLFGRFVDPKVVDSVLARPDEQILRAESREISILFCDVVGFTGFAEKRAPDELFSTLSEYLSEMTEQILALGGTLDKYIGDAIMAFWGAPHEQPEHAALACEAALRIRRRTLERWGLKAGGPGFDVRIGIASGPAAVGAIGSRIRSEYTAIGDTVNFASRLEGANKSFDTHILISHKTRELIGERFHLRTIGDVRVVGKHSIVRIFELLGSRDGPVPAWLDRFETAWRHLEMGDCQTAIGELAQVLVTYNDRVIRMVLDRALRMRDDPDLVGELYFDLTTK